MLVISRAINESFTIHTPAGLVTVQVCGITGYGEVKIGIQAPRDWPIHRSDIKKATAPAGRTTAQASIRVGASPAAAQRSPVGRH